MKNKLIIGIFLLTLLSGCGTLDSVLVKDCNYDRDDYYYKEINKFRSKIFPTESIIMVGNSITAGGDWEEYFPDKSIVNFGIPGDDTFGVLHRINYVIERKPSKIFILIGVNDIRKECTDYQIINNYNTILWKLRKDTPNTKVYIVSMLPTDNVVRKNEDIVRLNFKIKKMATLSKNNYVDIYNKFLGTDGNIKPEYVKDGIHLTDLGYSILVNNIKEYIGE